MTRGLDDPARSIRRLRAGAPSGRRLVCFPHAGGSASYFAPLARLLDPDVEVFAAQYPGRQDRSGEPLIEDIDKLADLLFDALTAIVDRPVLLFGHSMGAVLAFEVARRLEQTSGPHPVAVIVSGRQAPSLPPDEDAQWDDDALRAELRSLGGTDQSVLDNDDLAELVLPILRADFKALASYRPAPDASVRAPIIGFVGESDSTTPVADVRAWRRHTLSWFDLQVFPGDHFYLGTVTADVATALNKPGLA